MDGEGEDHRNCIGEGRKSQKKKREKKIRRKG